MADPIMLFATFAGILTFLVLAIWFYSQIYPLMNKSGMIHLPITKQFFIEHPDFGIAKITDYTSINDYGDYKLKLKNQNRGVFTLSKYNKKDYEVTTELITGNIRLKYNPDKLQQDREEIVKTQLYSWKNLALTQSKDINNAIEKVLQHYKQLQKTSQKDKDKKDEETR